MGAQPTRKVADKLRLKESDGARGATVARGVDEDDVIRPVELGEQVDPAGAAVEQAHAGHGPLVFQGAEDVDAHALVAHEQVADAEHEHAVARRALRGGGVGFANQGGVDQAEHGGGFCRGAACRRPRASTRDAPTENQVIGFVFAGGGTGLASGKAEMPWASSAATLCFSMNFQPPMIDDSTPWPST